MFLIQICYDASLYGLHFTFQLAYKSTVFWIQFTTADYKRVNLLKLIQLWIQVHYIQ